MVREGGEGLGNGSDQCLRCERFISAAAACRHRIEYRSLRCHAPLHNECNVLVGITERYPISLMW